MNDMYVEYDKPSGTIILKIPEEYREYEKALYGELYNAYAFETITVSVLDEMNNFIKEWFAAKGIQLS